MQRLQQLLIAVLACLASCDPPEPRALEFEPSDASARTPADPPAVTRDSPEIAVERPARSQQAVEPLASGAAVAGGTADGGVRVLARFLGPDGAPCPETVLSLVDRTTSAKCGEDGRAVLELHPGSLAARGTLELVARAPGAAFQRVRVSFQKGQVLDLGDLKQEPECRLRGSVVGEDGQEIPTTIGICAVTAAPNDGAEARRHGPASAVILGVQAPGEGFDVGEVPAGEWRLWATSQDPRMGHALSEPFQIGCAELREGFTLVVPRLAETDTVEGRVVDQSGRPMPQWHVTLLGASSSAEDASQGKTDELGRFVLRVHGEAPRRLVAWGFRQEEHAWLEEVRPGARGVELRAVENGSRPRARLRVLAPEGFEVKQFLCSASSTAGFPPHGWSAPCTQVAPDLFEFELPLVPFDAKLAATLRGERGDELAKPAQWNSVDPRTIAPETTLRLSIRPRLRGVVVAAGAPVEGATIQSCEALSGDRRMTIQGFPCRMNVSSGGGRPTRADGSFRIPAWFDGQVYLRCTAPGHAPTIAGPFDPERDYGELTIELGPGGALEGRVLGRERKGVAGVLVGASCGDGEVLTQRSDIEGAFRFGGLAAGKWLVREASEEARPDAKPEWSHDTRPTFWSCEVVPGITTKFDLVIDR